MSLEKAMQLIKAAFLFGQTKNGDFAARFGSEDFQVCALLMSRDLGNIARISTAIR
jgi:hypothetical protein